MNCCKEETKLKTSDELIQHMKNKNIRFEKKNEHFAKTYLTEKNYYQSVYMYNKNFKREGNEFTDLDFAYLVDLSYIDIYCKSILFKMINIIEHFYKLKILNCIETLQKYVSNVDEIVPDYIDKYNHDNDLNYDNNKFKNEYVSPFKTAFKHAYSKLERLKIIEKYNVNDDCTNLPVFIFVEIFELADLNNLYKHIISKYSPEEEQNVNIRFEADQVRKLRNAIAHDNRIINDLESRDNNFKKTESMHNYLVKCGIFNEERFSALRNTRLYQITATFYLFDKLVTDKDLKNDIKLEWKNLFEGRMLKNANYYNDKPNFIFFYNYLIRLIDNI